MDKNQTDNVLQDESQSLKRAVEELSILNDLAQAVAASTDVKEMLGTIVKRALKALNAEQGVITLVDEGNVGTANTLVRVVVRSSDQMKFHFHEGLLGWMLLKKQPLLLNNPKHHPQFNQLPWDEPITSLLCAPMMVKGILTGVITVYNSNGTVFGDNDQRLLTIIAAQMAHIVENMRLEEEKKEIQMRIARDLHDGVASSLSSIALYGERVKHLEKHLTEQSAALIDRMCALSLDAVEAMGDIVWSITPDQETLDSLLIRIKHHAQEMCTAKGMQSELHFPQGVNTVAVAQSTLKNVYLIFKEAMHNIDKHSNAHNVQVTIEVRDKTIFMSIRDDGKGFEHSLLKRRNGLRNMAKRAEEIQADIDIWSEPGKGTHITLSKKLT